MKLRQVNDMNKFLVFTLLQFLIIECFCQHEQLYDNETTHEARFHKISLVMANSLITNSVDDINETLIVPTFGINYDYWFKEKWGVGLHTDLVLQQYKIERHDDQSVLERDNPMAFCAIVSYEPLPRWIIMGGYGIEIERNENIDLFRFGLEYGIPLKDHWELGFNIEYDHKIKAYSSIMFGIVFSKIL